MKTPPVPFSQFECRSGAQSRKLQRLTGVLIFDSFIGRCLGQFKVPDLFNHNFSRSRIHMTEAICRVIAPLPAYSQVLVPHP